MTMISNLGIPLFVIVASIILLVVVILLALFFLRQRKQLQSSNAQFEALKIQAASELQMKQVQMEQDFSQRIARYEENEKLLQAAYTQLYKPYSQLTRRMSEKSFSADLNLLHEQLLISGILMMDILPVACRDANITSSNLKNVELLLENNSDFRRREISRSPAVSTNTIETSLEAIALNQILRQNGVTTFDWLLDGCKYSVQ